MQTASLRKLVIVSRGILWLAVCGALAPAWAQQGGFTIGQQVAVQASTAGGVINLRQAPGLSTNVLTTLPDGTVMTVVGGPQSADGYVWWEIEGEPGRGWAAESLLRPVAGAGLEAGESATVLEGECEPEGRAMAGVSLCQRPGLRTHVVVIDMLSPHVRFETELADTRNPPNPSSTARALVSDMAQRHSGVAAAINADYFGSGHGAEGLTIKNGVRLDTLTSSDRSALLIGKSPLDDPDVFGPFGPIRGEVFWLQSGTPVPDTSVFFNAVGGGPQVVFDGQWEWTRGTPHPRYVGCPADADVINGECFFGTGSWSDAQTPWTAVGLTGEDKMVWVVGPYSEVKATFEAFGVQTAIKLDGGGSTQLWYDQALAVESTDQPDRPVAEALLVFSLHAARVVEQPQWPVIVEKETLTIRITLENTGADTWKAGEYSLVNDEGPWGADPSQPLPHDVSPGETVTFEWTTEPISPWGVKRTRWHMAQGDVAFPQDAITINIVVIPEQLAKEREKLERQIQEWIEEQKENIEQLIIDYIEKQLRSICNPSGALGLPALAVAIGVWNKRRHRRPGSA